MTSREGKLFIQDCITECGLMGVVDDYFVYKYGNRNDIENYQHDEILTQLKEKDFSTKAKYVIKCFLHSNAYVVWPLVDGAGNRKLIVNKNHLLDLIRDSKSHPHSIYEVSIGTKGKAFMFIRDKTACTSFINKYIGIQAAEQEAPTHV